MREFSNKYEKQFELISTKTMYKQTLKMRASKKMNINKQGKMKKILTLI